MYGFRAYVPVNKSNILRSPVVVQCGCCEACVGLRRQCPSSKQPSAPAVFWYWSTLIVLKSSPSQALLIAREFSKPSSRGTGGAVKVHQKFWSRATFQQSEAVCAHSRSPFTYGRCNHLQPASQLSAELSPAWFKSYTHTAHTAPKRTSPSPALPAAGCCRLLQSTLQTKLS